jgi:hypothetical protein
MSSMKLLMIICLLAMTSCLPEATSLSEELKCTLFGSEDAIALKMDSDSPLPPNIAIVFEADGSEIVVDECAIDQVGGSGIFIEQDRSSAAARFAISKPSVIHEFYFPGGSSDPIVDTAAFKIYQRATCADSRQLVSERPNNVVTWLPVFANGEKCKKTSNTGYSSFKLIP